MSRPIDTHPASRASGTHRVSRVSRDERPGHDDRTSREDGLIREDDHRSRPDRAGPEDQVNGAADVPGAATFSVDWLALREGADAAARATDLLDPLRAYLEAVPRGPERALVIRDLGCGTGSMGRWLAGRLPGPQHWIMHDRDPALLARAGAGMPERAADGSRVSTRTRQGDLTAMRGTDLAGTSLVTASALLDLLTEPEVGALATACDEAGCAALLTLSVAGSVALDPADPLDAELAAAFDDHQRRVIDGRRLLGPDAVAAATEAYERRGARVRVGPSPWRLGPEQAALSARWLRGWVAAAIEQRPDLAAPGEAYLRRRLDACAAGELDVTVQHLDLLAVPASTGGGTR